MQFWKSLRFHFLPALGRHPYLLFCLALLVFAIAFATWLFSDSFASDDSFQIRTRMALVELSKPPVIYHTDKVALVEIIPYPKPELAIDEKILRDLDCPLTEYGFRYCSPLDDKGPSASLPCFSLTTPDSLLGGLSPNYPIASCTLTNGRYVYQSGCLISVGGGYLIERQAKYELIDSFTKLKAVYAPIESENEALSFAMAATGYSPLYQTEISPDTEYFIPKLENTNVRVRGNDYLVRLYKKRLCGCRQHETIAIDVVVTRLGDIREIYREEVFRDIHTECID